MDRKLLEEDRRSPKNNVKKNFWFFIWSFVFFFGCRPQLSYATLTAQWMQDLYSSRPEIKLRDIVVPGTHNSGTSQMNLFSRISPGDPILYQLIRPSILSWSRCQFLNLYQQLINGIRKLDLRIAFVRSKPYIVHGMVSQSLEGALLDVKRFVLKHPQEVVLIRFRKYFPLRKRDSDAVNASEERLTRNLFKQILGRSLRDFSQDVRFRDFWSQKQSVMIVNDIDDYWANTTDLQDLRLKSTSHLNRRNPERFHEISLIFTSPEKFTFFLKPRIAFSFHARSNALSVLSKPIRDVATEWIDSWAREGKKINVVSTDFVGLWPFAKSVIQINRRRL